MLHFHKSQTSTRSWQSKQIKTNSLFKEEVDFQLI